jgi:hypothetical protein
VHVSVGQQPCSSPHLWSRVPCVRASYAPSPPSPCAPAVSAIAVKILRGQVAPLPAHYSPDLQALVSKLLTRRQEVCVAGYMMLVLRTLAATLVRRS